MKQVGYAIFSINKVCLAVIAAALLMVVPGTYASPEEMTVEHAIPATDARWAERVAGRLYCVGDQLGQRAVPVARIAVVGARMCVDSGDKNVRRWNANPALSGLSNLSDAHCV